MKSARAAMICVVYDSNLAKHVGKKNAQALDWLYAFLHLADKNMGELHDGRRWGAFTYAQLAELSNALPNAAAWKRALTELAATGLIFVERVVGVGNYYTINFAKVRELVGEDAFRGYAIDIEKKQDDIPNWLSPHPPRPRAKRADHPAQNAPTTQRNLPRPPAQNAPTPIYKEIDSSFDSSIDKDSSSSDEDGADRTADVQSDDEEFVLSEPADVFTAICRVVFSGFVIDAQMRKEALALISQIQNTQIYVGANQREKPHLDPQIIEDYCIWRMLIQDSGRNGFPAKQEFLDEFRFSFFKMYWFEKNRKPIEAIKAEYPNWRTRLFTDDYAAFRAEVQARWPSVTATTSKNKTDPAWRIEPIVPPVADGDWSDAQSTVQNMRERFKKKE